MRKRILAITSGTIHPKLNARLALKRELRRSGKYRLVSRGRISAALSLGQGGFDAVLLYLHRRKISGDALRCLQDFVEKGGGLYAIHSASASFKSCDAYFQLLGGRFTGHDRVREYRAEPVPGVSDIFSGCRGFTIRDELYIHETYEGITTYFTAEHEGGTEPVVWTKTRGRGRICYFAPGHCTGTMRNPDALSVIMKGLDWVCGIEEEGAGS